jgi:hypothetical protein
MLIQVDSSPIMTPAAKKIAQYALKLTPHPMLRGAKPPDFSTWINGTLNTPPGEKAGEGILTLSARSSRPLADFHIFVGRIMEACFAAAHYKPNAIDPVQEWVKEQWNMARAAQTVSRVLGDFGAASRIHARFQINVKKAPNKRSKHEILAALLEQFSSDIRSSLRQLGSDPLHSKQTFACLKFGSPTLDNPKKPKSPSVAQALLFNLAHLFRRWNNGASVLISHGPMPKGGEPCFPIAVALLEATLGEKCSTNSASNRLTSLNQSRNKPLLIRWPNLDPHIRAGNKF